MTQNTTLIQDNKDQTAQQLKTSSSTLEHLRNRAKKLFDQSEWPTKSLEEYRRTDLSSFQFDTFQNELSTYSAYVDTYSLDKIEREREKVTMQPEHFVFPGLVIAPLESSFEPVESTIHKVLYSSFEGANNKIQYWHYAHLHSGCVIIAHPQLSHDKSVVLEYHFDNQNALYTPHTIIYASPGADLNVVIVYRSLQDVPLCVNAAVTIFCDAHSNVRCTEVQHLGKRATFFSHGNAVCFEESKLKRDDIALGGDLVKTRFVSVTKGRHVDIDMQGIFISSQKQHKDIRIVQRHESGQSKSRSIYRGLVQDQGRSVFQGMISVDRNARGTDAYLSNDNIIMNDGARADSIPALHIDTNDVKCSHGSTTGKLDKNKIFYLMCRGLCESDARKVLIQGFFEKILHGLSSETAGWIGQLIKDTIDNEIPAGVE